MEVVKIEQKNALATMDGIEKVKAKLSNECMVITVIAKQEILEAVIEEKITDLWF